MRFPKFRLPSRTRPAGLSVTVIGDTHGRHEELRGLSGDVLIHCGDMFDLFDDTDTDIGCEDLDLWFGRQDFDLILCIGGNHDRPVEQSARKGQDLFTNAVYLQDLGYEHAGVRFYGTPWVPGLPQHAFFADDDALQRAWAQIPNDTDVLITHTPPLGILDRSSQGRDLGCPHLARKVVEVAPQYHCFGHVHASGGVVGCGETTFVNASSVQSKAGTRLRSPVQLVIGPDKQG